MRSSALVDSPSRKVTKKKPRDPAKAMARVSRKLVKIDASMDVINNPPEPSKGEKEFLEEYQYWFTRLQRLTRKKLKQVYANNMSSRDIYALNILVSQQRELIADIRSVTDMSEHASRLAQGMLQPMIQAIAQNMLDSFYIVRRMFVEHCAEEDTQRVLKKLDNLIGEQGKYLQEQYLQGAAQIDVVLRS